MGRLVRHRHARRRAAHGQRDGDRPLEARGGDRARRRSIARRSMPRRCRGVSAPTSDIAALMVFDHQGHAINLLTRLGWETRIAAAEGAARFLEGRACASSRARPSTTAVRRTKRRSRRRCSGVSGFAKTFQRTGPRDRHGPIAARARSADAAVQVPLQLHDLFAGVRRAAGRSARRGVRAAARARSRDRDTIEILDDTKAGLALMTLMWVMVGRRARQRRAVLIGQWAADRARLGVPVRHADRQPRRLLRARRSSRSSPSSASWNRDLRAAIAAGFLGGFTTYSSFNQETLALFAGGATGAAVLNVAITLAGGLAGRLAGPRRRPPTRGIVPACDARNHALAAWIAHADARSLVAVCVDPPPRRASNLRAQARTHGFVAPVGRSEPQFHRRRDRPRGQVGRRPARR